MNSNNYHTLSNKWLTAKINLDNAEIESLVFNDKEYIYQRNNNWKRCWPILFPFAGKLAHDSYTLNNKKYDMKRHGFVRDYNNWKCIKKNGHVLVLEFQTLNKFREIYPFEFTLRLEYRLLKQSLSNTLTIINDSKETMTYGFGWHPAFIMDHQSGYIRPQFSSKITKLPLSGYWKKGCTQWLVKKLNFDRYSFDNGQSYGFWDNNNQHFTFGDDRRTLEMICNNYPLVLVWTENDASDYICIEPWASFMDEQDTKTTNLNEKKGILTLLKGKKVKYNIVIHITK